MAHPQRLNPLLAQGTLDIYTLNSTYLKEKCKTNENSQMHADY